MAKKKFVKVYNSMYIISIENNQIHTNTFYTKNDDGDATKNLRMNCFLSKAFYLWFWCGKQNDRPYVILAMPFIFILSIYPVFLMAMLVNMILVMYVILCILSYDFNKNNNVVYTCTYLSLISMTNKSELTFFLSIKYMSVCICRRKA